MSKRKLSSISDGLADAFRMQQRGGFSDRALSDMLAQKGRLQPNTYRKQIRVAAEAIAGVQRQEAVPRNGGGSLDMWMAEPERTMQLCAQARDDFAAALDKVVCSHDAGHCYRLVLYYDEITVGNPLVVNTARKYWLFYWSLLEFGHYLHHTAAWVPMLVLHSKAVPQIAGGFSGLVACLLRCLQPMLDNGIRLDLPTAGPRVLLGCFWANLADYDGLKKALDIKGAAGVVPCPKCKNIVNRGRLPHGHAYLRTIACSDTSQLDQHTDDSMRASCAALAAARAVMSRADFAEEEKARGVRYNPAGLLFSAGPRFLAISTLRFDPMHVWWSNGVASREIFLVLTAMEGYGVTWGMVDSFCRSKFTRPAGLPKTRLQLSPEFRLACRRSGLFKGSAAQTLDMVFLLCHFVESVLPRGTARALEPILKSLRCLTDTAELVLRARAPGSSELSEPLRVSIEAHLSAFHAAHGEDEVTPKHHLQLHVPDQLLADGQILDCFTAERKNKIGKNLFANTLQSGGTVQRCHLRRLLLHQLIDANELRADGLTGRCIYGLDIAIGEIGVRKGTPGAAVRAEGGRAAPGPGPGAQGLGPGAQSPFPGSGAQAPRPALRAWGSSGEACFWMGIQFSGGDLVCRDGLYFQVELAVRQAGALRLMAIPLQVRGREGRAAVLRLEEPAPRVLLEPRGLQHPRYWYPREGAIVAF